MKYQRDGAITVLKLDKGEEIIKSVEKVCSELGIAGGAVFGIGAAGEVCLRVYLPQKDEFREDIYCGVLEIVSLNGNVCGKEEGAAAHLHGLFSYIDEKERSKLCGGHLKSAIVSHTAEIFILPANRIGRVSDENLKIDVWDL